MPNNDKKGNLFSSFSWKINREIANKECKKEEINMQNKLDMLFQLFRAIGGPNHMTMEHSLLSRCNHKAGLNGPIAYFLA